MSLYVMVSADFPFVDPGKREKIYKCLEERKWTRVPEVGRDISTVWYTSFEEGISYEGAIVTSKDDFMSCARFYTTPKLVIHAGPNRPSVLS